MTETTHRCPPGEATVTPCCGLTPFELPPGDRMTISEGLVTCTGPRKNGGWGRVPSDADLDAIAASSVASCHVLKNEGPGGGMVLVSDLVDEIRRLRDPERSVAS